MTRPIRDLVDDTKRLTELKMQVAALREALRLFTWPDALTTELMEENRKESNTTSTLSFAELRGMAESFNTALIGLENKISIRESQIYLECHTPRPLDIVELRARIVGDLAAVAQLFDPTDPGAVLARVSFDAQIDAAKVITSLLDKESAGRR